MLYLVCVWESVCVQMRNWQLEAQLLRERGDRSSGREQQSPVHLANYSQCAALSNVAGFSTAPLSPPPSTAHCLLHPAFHFSADLRCKWSCLWLCSCLCHCHHCADNDNDNDEADLAPHSTHSHTLLLLLPCCAGCEFSFQLCKYDKWVEQSDTPPHMQRGQGEKECERRKCTASRHFVRQWENAGWKPQQFVATVRWLRHTHIHTGRHT